MQSEIRGNATRRMCHCELDRKILLEFGYSGLKIKNISILYFLRIAKKKFKILDNVIYDIPILLKIQKFNDF